MSATRDTERPFPTGFLWGTATSAYQIEGAATEDGRGPSIWDVFAALPGRIHRGDTGSIACDHYHRWREDLDLMSALGLSAYRFSVSWPRVLPEGVGAVNKVGLGFYDRLVDGLLERGITPALTLYHWDLPVALQERGGWLSVDTVKAFCEYTQVMVDALGDRVPLWMTINEPWVAGMLGHGTRALAPGLGDGVAAVSATHQMLLAHGEAARLLRSAGQAVGIVLNLSPMVPGSPSTVDHEAAHRFDGYLNRWFTDAVLRGSYPADLLAWYGPACEEVLAAGDVASIAAPLDFLGVNYYCRMHVRAGHDPDDPLAPAPSLDAHTITLQGVPATALGWPVEPAGLTDILMRLRRDYPNLPPIYLTENGAAYEDYVDPEGRVEDTERISFLDGNLRALHTAIESGVDVRGYFCWSLLDNFEWWHGYSKRFGLVYVDFATQRRVPKASAAWYRDVIARNGLP